MWVRFTSDFDWSPRYGVVIAYKDGWTGNVTRRCGEAAVAANKAVRMQKAGKDDEPTHVHVKTRESVVDGWVTAERMGEPVLLVDTPDG